MGLSACRLLETLGQGSDHNQWNVCDVKKKLTVEVGTLTWVASDYSSVLNKNPVFLFGTSAWTKFRCCLKSTSF